MRVFRNGKWVSLDDDKIENFTAKATADSGSTSSKTWLWVLLGVVAIVAVIAIVVFLIKRSKKASYGGLSGFTPADFSSPSDGIELASDAGTDDIQRMLSSL